MLTSAQDGLHALRYVAHVLPSSHLALTRHHYTAWRVQPRNYLLFACHMTNATAQSVQDARFVNYWYNGGREKKLGITAGDEAPAPGKVTEAVKAAREEAKKSEEK